MGWWPDGTYRWLSFKNKILTRARSLRARRRLAKRTALKMLPRKEKKAAAKAKMVLRRRKGRCQPWDMRSEWWGDMFWPTKRPRQRQWHLENSFKEQSKRLIIFLTLGNNHLNIDWHPSKNSHSLGWIFWCQKACIANISELAALVRKVIF